MATIEPVLIENPTAILALKTDLGGLETVGATLDLKDHASGPFDVVDVWIGYAAASTPAAGLKVWIYAATDVDGASKQFHNKALEVSFDETTPTTVDADSSGTTLNVAATTAFAVGDLIVIDQENGNSERQWNTVTAITAGVSLTVQDTLSPSPTAANASEVQVWQTQRRRLTSPWVYARFLVQNEDTDGADDCAVQITFTAQNGYLST